jgi:alpha-galactosidase
MARELKITFVGAGSIVFTRELLGDIYLYPRLAEATISLMDIDRDRLEMAGLVAEELKAERGRRNRIEAHPTLAPALEGADYVVNVVQVGGKESTYLDFDIPEKYGLRQTIADTHGICGMMRFLRTVPHLEELCETMNRVCPDAFLLNFTNPMSMCQWYLNAISRRRTIGLCHSVPGTIETLASYLGVPVGEVSFLVAGINHMAWVLKLERRGEDLYPLLRLAMENPDVWSRDPVRFEIMRHFSYFVTESSEHMAEYVPYFLKDEDAVQRLQIPVREYVTRVELNDRAFQAERDYYLNGKTEMKGQGPRMVADYYRAQGKPGFEAAKESGQVVEPSQSREYAVQIIHAIEADDGKLIYGVGPNAGIVSNLPPDCMVDSPCYVDGTGVHAAHVGELPPQLVSLIQPQIDMQRLAVRAALTRERRYIHYAALADPLASAVLTINQIHDLTEELLEAHGKHMPEFT